jgi:monoamine oxidase
VFNEEDQASAMRRDFLKILAAGAASAAGSAFAAAPASRPLEERRPGLGPGGYDVLVVGAGFAGLTAARELSRAGMKVLLVDARNRLGGRTFTSSFLGQKIELGGTWIHWSQPFVWNEVVRYGLGLAESPGAAAETASWLVDGKLRQGGAERPWKIIADAMTAFCDVDRQGGRQVMQMAHDPLFRKDLLIPWDRLSLQDRLDQMKFGRETRDLLSPQLSINCHASLKDGGFADMLRWWALGEHDMGRMFDKLGRYKIKEGMGELARRMLDDSDADLLLSSPVKSVSREGDTYVVVTDKGQTFTTRAVVMATPLNVLANISMPAGWGAGKRSMIERGHVGRGSKCYVHIRQKVGNWIGMAPAPHPISLAWTEKQRDDGTLLVCFGPPNLLDITDEEAVQAALRTLLPKVEVLGVTGYQWAVDPYSQGTWCWYRPGQLTQGLPGLRSAEGGIFMAGSDQAEGWRGFVDGAIESGITAARDVRAYLKG